MKKRTVLLTLMLSLFTGCLTACSSVSNSSEPDITQIRSICEMATLECYYHNVAKSTKEKEKGLTHLGEKDREFWIEYDGTVKLGIDMSQVKLSVEGNDITITIPEAKVLDVTVNEDSYNDDSYIMSEDGFNKNKITAKDATAAINDANETMEETAQENSTLLMNAQDRAKKLIENYITQIGEAADTEYNIHWEYVDNDSSADS